MSENKSSYLFFSTKKMLALLEEHNLKRISDLALKYEAELTGRSEKEIFENMDKRLEFMETSIKKGLEGNKSISGLTSLESKRMNKMIGKDDMLLSDAMLKGTTYALGVMNCNGCMGRVVASPTAGSAGVVPGAVLATVERFNLPREAAVRAMLTAGAVGVIIAKGATFSAAKAGCQAEIGTSTAMAAAAISEIRGMTPAECMNAAALALKNMLGLACDPIGGLVEVPCVKRNAIGVAHAMTASDMSKAGIRSFVGFDEVLIAMNNIAAIMPSAIRETAKGGLASTPTGQKIAKKFIKLT